VQVGSGRWVPLHDLLEKCQEYLEDLYGKVRGDQVRGFVKKEEPEADIPTPGNIEQVSGRESGVVIRNLVIGNG